MDKELVKKIVSNKLSEINFKEEINLLVGTHTVDQTTLGKYFIDFEDDNIDMNLSKYQEKYISSDYYKTPGYLQWNCYLIFLRNHYDNSQRKLEIEKDTTYTRKFVFTPEELNNYFNYQHSEQAVDSDIISVWKEKLRKVDLDETFSETFFKQAIERFISNEVKKDSESESKNTATAQDLVINRVSNIKLNNNYRQYPTKKEFNLGQVNLITGVNGAGKTSFLESIELVIAGKSNRDPSFKEKSKSIEALYNSEFKDFYTPSNNGKYRERDHNWYSSAYIKGNELYRAFNKYNYYDSDAAYNLSHESSVENLTKYLSSIALGTEFNRIQRRLIGFKERLEGEKKVRSREIKEKKGRIKEAYETIKNTQLTSNPEDNFKVFIACSKEVNWKKVLPKSHNDSFSGFTEDYQIAQSLISSLNQLFGNVRLNSIQSIKDELINIDKVLEDLKDHKVKIEQLEEIIRSEKKSISEIKKKKQILVSAKKFYEDKTSFDLLNLNDRINDLKVKIKENTRVQKFFDSITDLKILDNKVTFDSFKKEQLDKEQKLESKRKELSKQIENLKHNLSMLQQLVSDIKSYGKRYISINQSADACPLCETPFSFDELSSRITKIAKDVSENVKLDQLNEQFIQVEKELSSIKKIQTNIQYIESGASIIESNFSQLSLADIGEKFNASKNRLKQDIESEKELLRLKEALDDKGLYEDDFNRSKEQVENLGLRFIYEDKVIYETRLLQFEREEITTLKDIEEKKTEIGELSSFREKVLKNAFPNVEFSDYEKELSYKANLLSKGIDYSKNLSEYLSFTEDEDIADISQKIDKLFKLYENVSRSISSQKELKLANQIIVKSKERIKNVEPELERISNGLKVIDDILKNYGESKVLGNFIEKNEEEIQEIFQSIHSPKEFSQIVFNQEKRSVLLKRRIDGQDVPLNKISTGQRSALALSIFLALNKKLKSGPNLILFDDPVTYTDDLNVLSFLDYLREIVIHEKRQLIFATANQKLAGLFEKKFEFLGDEEFKKFPFERS